MGRDDQAWAVFRCSLLSPVLLEQIPAGQRESYFQELSQQEHLLPNGRRRRISARTLRRWWKKLREQGVQGMFRRPRNDRDRPRKRAQLLERAIQLKREQPRRSDQVINRILLREFGAQVPRSTLYRHLRQQGATRRKLGVSKEPVRCRWTRDHSNALWVGDFEHGPVVLHAGRAVQTHLSAWIDCHSRYVVEARYYIRENLDILIDSLLRAWTHHGASRELYVDNAKIYHAHALVLACTQLNIQLLHRPPRDPAPGGLIERFFGTLQGQFEAEVKATRLLTLADLNQDLQAWLEIAYHRQIHSQTKQTPWERYHAACRFQRHVEPQTVREFFRRSELRTVHPDFSDVRIDNDFYAVDPQLRGDRVVVKFDPFQTDEELQEVELFSPSGTYLGVGKKYHRERGFHTPPSPPPATEPIEPAYLQALRAAQAEAHQQQRASGIDYHTAQRNRTWSLTRFAGRLAKLLGRTGGISSLDPGELETLRLFHEQHPRLNESLLKQAFTQAEPKSIPLILFQLQSLLEKGNV